MAKKRRSFKRSTKRAAPRRGKRTTSRKSSRRSSGPRTVRIVLDSPQLTKAYPSITTKRKVF